MVALIWLSLLIPEYREFYRQLAHKTPKIHEKKMSLKTVTSRTVLYGSAYRNRLTARLFFYCFTHYRPVWFKVFPSLLTATMAY